MGKLKLFLKTFMVLAVSCLIFGQTMTAKAETIQVSFPATADFDDVNEVLRLVNIERRKANLSPYILDQELTASAMLRASEISLCYGHTRPDGTKWATSITTPYYHAGENIAAGYGTPAEVVAGWMASTSGHRENILSSTFTRVGLGCLYQADGTKFWVQEFADLNGLEVEQSGKMVINSTVSIDVKNLAFPGKEVQVVDAEGVVVTSSTALVNDVGNFISIIDLPGQTIMQATTPEGKTLTIITTEPELVLAKGFFASYDELRKEQPLVTKPSTITTSEGTPLILNPANQDVQQVIATTEEKVAKMKVPSFTYIKAGKKKITLRYKKFSSYNGYHIRLKTLVKRKFKSGKKTITQYSYKTKNIYTTKNPRVVNKLLKKRTYKIRVRGYVVLNGKKYYGRWSSMRSVKTK